MPVVSHADDERLNIASSIPFFLCHCIPLLAVFTGVTHRAIVLFVTERRVLERKLPELRRRLADTGMLWVAWPKRASGVATDVTEDTIRDFAVENTDLVDVKVIAIDDTWSGLKLMVRRSARSSKR